MTTLKRHNKVVCLLLKNFGIYCISRNIDSDFNLVIWRWCKDHQTNLSHYRSIYTTSMGFSPYSNEIRQFKIQPTVFSDQTTQPNVRLYFCLYGMTS